MKKNILIITDANTKNSSIEYHQIQWLKENYILGVIAPAIGDDHLNDVKYYNYSEGSFTYKNIRKILLLLRFFRKYTLNKNIKKIIKQIEHNKYDVIIVHHLRLLPIAHEISNESKIIFHAHEYYMAYNNDLLIWKLLIKNYWNWIAVNYINKSDLIITVNESIKNFYKSNYHGEVYYLHNLVPYEDSRPSHIDQRKIEILHHGLASKSRRIELMIEIANYLDDRFKLSIVLVNHSLIGKLYIKKLKRLAKGNHNVTFPDPVSFRKIVKFGNKYDIGLFFMPPSNLNEEYSLGHKFFQYIQSRLALAISPLPEMKKLVEEYDLGIISSDYNPKSLADKLNDITIKELRHYKNNSNKYAKKFDVDSNREKFFSILEKIL